MEGTLENGQAYYNLKGKIVSIPQVDDTLTKKGYSADAKKVGEEFDERVKYADIIDNLTTVEAKKALSANQGKLLKDMIDKINLSQAATVGYDNKTSGLESTNMQEAIDEVANDLKDAKDALDNIDESLDDYLPKSGGMVEGAVRVRNADNGYGQLMKNNSADADYGTQLSDTSKDGETAKVSISALLGTLTYTDANQNIRDIHHEGNKPFGSYTGNGSAVTQTIDTQGIGRLAIVYNKDNFSFVTPQGALSVDTSAGEIKWIESSKVYFLNGTLGITTTSEAFNVADKEYYYQVI